MNRDANATELMVLVHWVIGPFAVIPADEWRLK